MADRSTLGIDVNLDNLGQFTSNVDAAIKPIQQLNTAIGTLAKTLNKLDGGNTSSLSSLKKVAGELGDIVKLINSQESLGRGNLENLSRTAGTVGKFVLTLSTLDETIGRGGFKNIKDFSSIMKSVGDAFAAFDRIKRPANLVAIESAVRTLQQVLDMLEKSIPRSGKFSKFERVRKLAENLADALSAFSTIKQPENMQHAVSGVVAINRVLDVLERFNFNIIDRINRGRKLGQLENVAKSIAKVLSQFDKIKKPENLEKITPAINAINRIISSLSSVSASGQKLARGGLTGIFTQSGSLMEGFGAFAKQLQKSVKVFASFNTKQIKSIESAASMLNAIINLLRIFQSESDVMLRGGDVVADFSNKEIDTSNFKKIIDDLIDVAQYISKQRFDHSKVAALGTLLTEFNKVGSINISGSRDNFGIFSSLVSSARGAIDGVISIFRTGVRTLSTIFTTIFKNNPFISLARFAQETISQVSTTLRNFGREMTQFGTQLVVGGGIAGFLQSQQVGMVMDFESIMKQIEVLGGVTGEQLTKANALILQLGESSVFSATEVAAAFLDLSKAGLSVDQISASMEDMLNLAAAGEISVADASNLVINAVGAMGLSFEDATMIADTFVAAANVGVASVADLSAAFGYVGNTAGAMGQELDVVTAALTLMIDKGIDSTRAGTSLDAFMRSLIDPSTEAATAIADVSLKLREMENSTGLLSSMGISFEGDMAGLMTDAEGNYRDLNEMIKLITIATEDWTEAERVSTLTQIAGSANAARAILALTGTYEDGTYVIDEYIQKQNEAASAADVGAALMDTTRGSLEEMSGAFETLLLKALRPVIERGIRPLIDGMTFLIRQVSQIPEPILAGVAAFVGLSTVLVTLTGGFMVFSGVLMQIVGFGLTPLVALLTALVNPLRTIMLITAGQGLFMFLFAGAAFVLPLILSITGAFKAFKSGLDSIQGTPFMENFTNTITRFKTAIMDAFEAGKHFLDIIWQLTAPSGGNENQGLTYYLLSQIGAMVDVAARAIEEITKLFNLLSGLATFQIPGVSAIFSGGAGGFAKNFSVEDVTGLTKEQFAKAFGAPIEDLMGEFSFSSAKNWLVMNSTDYDNEIKKLHAMSKAAGGFADSIDFLEAPKFKQAVKSTSYGLRSIDSIMAALNEDSDAFQNIANSLEPFVDNPIVEMIFGKDVTGADLARSFALLLSTLTNLRTVGSRTLRTFADFFADLRNGEGVLQSFKNLIKGLLVDAGMLASVFLDLTTSALGLEGFDNLIASLASGNLEQAFKDLLVIALNAMIGTAQSLLSGAVDVIIWSWNTLLDFVDDVNWTQLFTDLWSTAKDTWNNTVKPRLSIAWNDILDFTGLGGSNGDNTQNLDAGNKILGPAFESVAQSAQSPRLVSLFKTAFGGITDAATFAWNSLVFPTLTWSWDKVLDITSSISKIDWSGVWDTITSSLRNAIFGGGGGGKDVIGNELTSLMAGNKGLEPAFESAAQAVSKNPILINLGDLIKFTGAQSVIDAFTGEWALAEGALQLLTFSVNLIIDVIASIGKILVSFGRGGGGGAPSGGGGGAPTAPTTGQPVEDVDWGAFISDLIANSLRMGGYAVVEIAEIFFDMDRTKWRGNVDAVADGLRDILDVSLSPIINDIVKPLDALVNTVKALNFEMPKLNDTQKVLFGIAAGITVLGLALKGFAAIGGVTGLQVLSSELGIVSTLGGLVSTLGIAVLAFLAFKGAIQGITDALPYLGQALSDLIALDLDGTLQNLTEAVWQFVTGFIDGVLSVLIDVGAGIAKILVGEDYVNQSLAMWKGITDAIGRFFSALWLNIKIEFYGLLQTIAEGIESGALGQALSALGINVDIGADKLQEIQRNLQREKIFIELQPTIAGMQAGQTVDAASMLGQLFQVDPSQLSGEELTGFTDLFTLAIQQSLAQVQNDPSLADSFISTLLDAVTKSGGLTPEQIQLLTDTLGADVVSGIQAALAGSAGAADLNVQDAFFSSFLYTLTPDIELLGLSEVPDAAALAEQLQNAYGAPLEQAIAMFVTSMTEIDRGSLQTAAGPGGDVSSILAQMFGLTPDDATALTEDLNKNFETLRGEIRPDFGILKEGILEQADKITGADIIDSAAIATEAQNAENSTTNLRNVFVNNFQLMTSEVDKLAAKFGILSAAGFTPEQIITIMMTSGGTTPEAIIPGAEPRAKGGPVFPDRLYEVAENGIGELLRIGEKTFLIPGQQGTVIPAQSASAPVTSQPSVPTPRPYSPYDGGGGETYVDQSQPVFQINGTGLDEDALRRVTYDAIDRYNLARSQKMRSKMRSKGY